MSEIREFNPCFAAHICDVEVDPDTGNSMHPYGVRGVGEAPMIPPLAAVGSAVSNAIGVHMTELPCSPPKVLAALKAKT